MLEDLLIIQKESVKEVVNVPSVKGSGFNT